jgi:hypothetical protein
MKLRRCDNMDIFIQIRKRFATEETERDKKYFVKELAKVIRELESELKDGGW